VTQEKQRVKFEVISDNGKTVKCCSVYSDTEKKSVDIEAKNHEKLQCVLLRDSGQNAEDSIVYSDPEPTDGTVRSTDRHWTVLRKQQWT
jgi:hypothetical protein